MMRVLVVDDDEFLAKTIVDGLVRRNMSAELAVTATVARNRLDRGDIDVVLLDVHLAGADGIELCAELLRQWPTLDVLVMSG